jgi:hypothetical protein
VRGVVRFRRLTERHGDDDEVEDGGEAEGCEVRLQGGDGKGAW